MEGGDDSGSELRPFLPRLGAREDSFVGDNATPNFVRDRSNRRTNLAQDLRPILGLENPRFAAYPFLAPALTGEQAQEQFISILPRSTDVTKYFRYYKTVVYVHSPMLIDINGFEGYIWQYLEKINAFERDPDNKSTLESLERDVGLIAVILATLSSGSQFSDLKLAQRISLSRDFSRRSFQCLRLANFLFRPSLDAIQALLILGSVMQNDGQSDGAWALLGLTVRLAQCIGLHTDRSAKSLPEDVQKRRSEVWNKIMWQDALLSLSFDRIPALAAYRMSTPDRSAQNQEFLPAMHNLCRIGLASLVYSGDTELQVEPLLQCLGEIDGLRQRVAPHLQNLDLCTSVQQRREFLALRLHSSFVISILARPAFRTPATQVLQPQHAMLMQRGRGALVETISAYLGLHEMDVYPRRSWSLIHCGLSSALLLGLLGESQKKPEILELQLRVIDLLSKTEEAEVSGGDVPTAWLSASHVRALRALRSTVQNGGSSRRNSQSSAITTDTSDAPASAPPAAASAAPTNNIAPVPVMTAQQQLPTESVANMSGMSSTAKDEINTMPWTVPTDNAFDPTLMTGFDGMPMDFMDFGTAMQHTGLSPMGYFDALYWDPNFGDDGLTFNTNIPPQQAYWGM